MKRLELEDIEIGKRYIYVYHNNNIVDLITVDSKNKYKAHFQIDAVTVTNARSMFHKPGRSMFREPSHTQCFYLNTPDNMAIIKEKYNITKWIR